MIEFDVENQESNGVEYNEVLEDPMHESYTEGNLEFNVDAKVGDVREKDGEISQRIVIGFTLTQKESEGKANSISFEGLFTTERSSSKEKEKNKREQL